MAEHAMQPYWVNKNFPEFAQRNPYSTSLYNLPEAALRAFSIPFAGIAGAAGEYAKTVVRVGPCCLFLGVGVPFLRFLRIYRLNNVGGSG